MDSMRIVRSLIILSFAAAIGCGSTASSSDTTDVHESGTQTEAESTEPQKLQTAVFAGGCFWGVEAVFEHLKGVKDVKAGYAGGDSKTANYEAVSNGRSDHAESVIVKYDPAMISYSQLLNVFFTVAHDPTQLNRQGPDVGRHYRSAIFYVDEEQRAAAQTFIDELTKAGTYPQPIVTELVPLKKFYNAESYHQDFMRKNPDQPYIVQHDKPKIEGLKNKFPDLFVDKRYVKLGR